MTSNNNQVKVIKDRIILTVEIVKDIDNMSEVFEFCKDTI